MDVYQEMKQGEKGAWLSICAYIVLSLTKLGIGFGFHSAALQADGWNNLTDIVASVAVLIGLRISQKPPDHDHPYGHFRAETVSALIASFIMATVGFQVLYTTVMSLIEGKAETPNPLTGWVALGCAAVMLLVYVYNRNLAKKINNQALMAAAQDNKSDAFVSIGAAIGIFGSQMGLPWLDPVAAFVVGILILKTAWEIFRSATLVLTDGFDEDELKTLRSTIEKTNGVREIREIKARLHGNQVFLDVIVLVDPLLTLIESHEISDEVELRLKKKHNIMHAHVHVEPLEIPDHACKIEH